MFKHKIKESQIIKAEDFESDVNSPLDTDEVSPSPGDKKMEWQEWHLAISNDEDNK